MRPLLDSMFLLRKFKNPEYIIKLLWCNFKFNNNIKDFKNKSVMLKNYTLKFLIIKTSSL